MTSLFLRRGYGDPDPPQAPSGEGQPATRFKPEEVALFLREDATVNILGIQLTRFVTGRIYADMAGIQVREPLRIVEALFSAARKAQEVEQLQQKGSGLATPAEGRHRVSETQSSKEVVNYNPAQKGQ